MTTARSCRNVAVESCMLNVESLLAEKSLCKAWKVWNSSVCKKSDSRLSPPPTSARVECASLRPKIFQRVFNPFVSHGDGAYALRSVSIQTPKDKFYEQFTRDVPGGTERSL